MASDRPRLSATYVTTKQIRTIARRKISGLRIPVIRFMNRGITYTDITSTAANRRTRVMLISRSAPAISVVSPARIGRAISMGMVLMSWKIDIPSVTLAWGLSISALSW